MHTEDCLKAERRKMNPKISKLKAEKEKNLKKIADMNARNEEIDKLITELENLDIIGLVQRILRNCSKT